jgi:putative ABC transport system permease protein
VGVRTNIRDTDPSDDGIPAIEVPFWQSPWPFVRVAVRTAGDPARVRQDVAAAIRAIDPDLPMGDVKTMEQMFSESLVSNRFNSALFGSFALVALLLAAIGIYGVMSFVVAQRTQEIGLRMALGAGRSRILVRVIAEGMSTALIGAAVGSLGAFYAARTMRGIITGLTQLDPVVVLGITASLLLSALIACAIPAARAASVDPMVALRRE